MEPGASDHMISSITRLVNYKPCKENIGITVADGLMCKAEGRGDMEFSGSKLKLILYVSDLKCNLR